MMGLDKAKVAAIWKQFLSLGENKILSNFIDYVIFPFQNIRPTL
jgi:hypothetical protein